MAGVDADLLNVQAQHLGDQLTDGLVGGAFLRRGRNDNLEGTIKLAHNAIPR